MQHNRLTVTLGGEPRELIFNIYAQAALCPMYDTLDALEAAQKAMEAVKTNYAVVTKQLIKIGLEGYYQQLHDKSHPFTNEEISEWLTNIDWTDIPKIFTTFQNSFRIEEIIKTSKGKESKKK